MSNDDSIGERLDFIGLDGKAREFTAGEPIAAVARATKLSRGTVYSIRDHEGRMQR